MEPLGILEILKIVVAILVAIISSKWLWVYVRERYIRTSDDQNYIKYDYRERILKLETFLERASVEKKEQRDKILKLEVELAQLRTKILFLEEMGQGSFTCGYLEEKKNEENEN